MSILNSTRKNSILELPHCALGCYDHDVLLLWQSKQMIQGTQTLSTVNDHSSVTAIPFLRSFVVMFGLSTQEIVL